MEHHVIRTVFNTTRTTLSSSFPFVRGEMLPANFSSPHLLASLFHPPLSPVLFFQFTSSLAFFTSLLTQSSHISFGLPRLLQPCSRNSATLFGCLSSAILSTCPAHCNMLLTSIYVKLLCTPVSSLNSANLRLRGNYIMKRISQTIIRYVN